MNIAVYCSAAKNLPLSLLEDASQLGAWIGSNSCRLVYGGVDAGLMTAVASATKENGAETVGVVPAQRYDCISPHNDITIRVSDLSERKRVMDTLADVFVVLPGGYGTLDELIGTFAHLNFTDGDKTVAILNSDGIFDPLLEQLELFVSRGLMKPACLNRLFVAADIEQLISFLDDTLKNTKI